MALCFSCKQTMDNSCRNGRTSNAVGMVSPWNGSAWPYTCCPAESAQIKPLCVDQRHCQLSLSEQSQGVYPSSLVSLVIKTECQKQTKELPDLLHLNLLKPSRSRVKDQNGDAGRTIRRHSARQRHRLHPTPHFIACMSMDASPRQGLEVNGMKRDT